MFSLVLYYAFLRLTGPDLKRFQISPRPRQRPLGGGAVEQGRGRHGGLGPARRHDRAVAERAGDRHQRVLTNDIE